MHNDENRDFDYDRTFEDAAQKLVKSLNNDNNSTVEKRKTATRRALNAVLAARHAGLTDAGITAWMLHFSRYGAAVLIQNQWRRFIWGASENTELREDEEVELETTLADIREKVHGNTWALREMCDCYDENFRRVFSQVEKFQEENAQLKQQLKDLHDRSNSVVSGQEASAAKTTPQSADDWRAVFAAGHLECAERCNRRALSAPPTGKRAQLEKMAWRPPRLLR